MNPQVPNLSNTAKGVILFLAGLILFLHVTKILTAGLDMILLLSSILLMIYGFVEMNGYHKLKKLFNKKH